MAKPWGIDPHLTKERLLFLKKLVLEIRSDAVDEQQPQKGDGPFGLGSRVYERTGNQLWEKCRKGEIPWLTVQRENPLYYVLLIEGTPLRIFRGDHLRPRGRYLRSGLRELKKHQRDFAELENSFLPAELPDEEKRFWLMAVETDDDHRGIRVVIEQANLKGEIFNEWVIDDAAEEPPAPVTPINKPARKLPRPHVGSKQTKKRSGDESKE
ncbi:MAG: hypothetical protein ABSA52_03810 [Candidatus Binatia bacterium]|jgi:hypothetical protein